MARLLDTSVDRLLENAKISDEVKGDSQRDEAIKQYIDGLLQEDYQIMGENPAKKKFLMLPEMLL